MEREERKTLSYLSFTLAGELFVIHVDYVVKILEMTTFTRIPQGPPYMLGVINLTGSVLPVIDTYKKFGLSKKENEKTVIIVLEINQNNKRTMVGITADMANEVFETDASQIKEYPAVGSKYNSEFIEGVIQRGDKFFLILNAEKLFGEGELFEIEKQTK